VDECIVSVIKTIYEEELVVDECIVSVIKTIYEEELVVDECIVSVIKTIYEEDGTTAVKINGTVSKSYHVEVGVHQGSVLSPLQFIIVLEALSRKLRGGLPLELLYADNFVHIEDT